MTVPELLKEIQAFLGSTIFGSIVGWLIRLMSSTPDTISEGIRRAVFAVGAALLFTDSLAFIFHEISGIPEVRLVIPIAGAVAYGGEHLIEAFYLWGVKKMKGRGDG